MGFFLGGGGFEANFEFFDLFGNSEQLRELLAYLRFSLTFFFIDLSG